MHTPGQVHPSNREAVSTIGLIVGGRARRWVSSHENLLGISRPWEPPSYRSCITEQIIRVVRYCDDGSTGGIHHNHRTRVVNQCFVLANLDVVSVDLVDGKVVGNRGASSAPV
jgi:hypothetical protein